MAEADTLLPRFLSIKAAANYSNLAESTLRALIRRGTLVGYRPMPGKVLVSVRELDAFIERSAGQRSTRGAHLQKSVAE